MTEPHKKVEIDSEELEKLRATAAETEAAKSEAEKSKKEVQAANARAALAAKRQQKEVEKNPAPEASAPKEEAHGHEHGAPHYIGLWQQYCPTCGDKNPDFKDETECDKCHYHLGAKEVAEKLKACPNCGSKSASVIHK